MMTSSLALVAMVAPAPMAPFSPLLLLPFSLVWHEHGVATGWWWGIGEVLGFEACLK
jgi:hypothetical protein